MSPNAAATGCRRNHPLRTSPPVELGSPGLASGSEGGALGSAAGRSLGSAVGRSLGSAPGRSPRREGASSPAGASAFIRRSVSSSVPPVTRSSRSSNIVAAPIFRENRPRRKTILRKYGEKMKRYRFVPFTMGSDDAISRRGGQALVRSRLCEERYMDESWARKMRSGGSRRDPVRPAPPRARRRGRGADS